MSEIHESRGSEVLRRLEISQSSVGRSSSATESRADEVRTRSDDLRKSGPVGSANIDAACVALRELQDYRKFCINLENKLINSLMARCRKYCGHDSNAEQDEATRDKQNRRAQHIVTAGLAAKSQRPEDEEIADALVREFDMVRRMLPPLHEQRDQTVKIMDGRAKLLPAATFIASVPGVTAHGLAIIVGEAGNLSNYSSERKLWRRLGFGMAPGHEAHAYSTWRRQGGLNSEDWTVAGYSPKRLGQIYGVVTEPLFRHKAKSRYGEVYAARRGRTLVTHPEWYRDKAGEMKLDKEGKPRSAHAMEDGKRVMTKAFLADLWREWRRVPVAG